MVKAEITISTCYGDAVIPVRVLGKGSRSGTAWVQALDGLEPFTKFSHGGPYQDSTSIVLIPNLRDIRIEIDPDDEITEEPVLENGIEVQQPASDPCVPADWFLESAYCGFRSMPPTESGACRPLFREDRVQWTT